LTQASLADPASLVQRFYAELWNRADLSVAQEILHPQLTFRGSLAAMACGRDGFLDYLRQVHAALADYRCTIDDLVATSDRAAARMTFTGIHRALFFGVPATGRRITWSGAAFFIIAERVIHKIWVLGDVDSIRQQLGVSGTTTFGAT
jgi:steroid delta-isomerase-like uncharacterized protein